MIHYITSIEKYQIFIPLLEADDRVSQIQKHVRSVGQVDPRLKVYKVGGRWLWSHS